MLNFRKTLVAVGLAAMCSSAVLAQAWHPTARVTGPTGTALIRQEGVTEPLGGGGTSITIAAGPWTAAVAGAFTANYDITFYLNSVNGTQLQFTSKNGVTTGGGNPAPNNHEITLTDNGSGGVVTHCPVASNGLSFTCSAVPLTSIVDALAAPNYDLSFTLKGIRVNATPLPAVPNMVTQSGITLTAWARPNNPAATTYPLNLFAGSQIYTTSVLAYAQANFAQAAPGLSPTIANLPAGGPDAANPGVVTIAANPTIATLPVCNPTNTLLTTSLTTDPLDPAGAPKAFAVARVSAAGVTKAATELTYEHATVAEAITNGTRVALTFSNIPAGVSVYVPWTVASAGGFVATTTNLNPTVAVLMNGLAADGSGTGTAAVATTPYKAVANGTTVFYEFTTLSTKPTDSLAIPLIAKYTAGTTPTAVANAITVSAQLAPISSATSTATPRFAGTPQVQSGFVTTSLCSTSLLFPYVTSQPGGAPWNTGIAISNTSSDPFSTTGQAGTCSVNFYGTDGTGAAQTKTVSFGAATAANGGDAFGSTTAIAPGTVAAGLISSSNAFGATATFSGYAIAVCNFQYGHGYSFVIGTNSKGAFSNGYLALVLQTAGAVTPTPRTNNAGGWEATSF